MIVLCTPFIKTLYPQFFTKTNMDITDNLHGIKQTHDESFIDLVLYPFKINVNIIFTKQILQ